MSRESEQKKFIDFVIVLMFSILLAAYLYASWSYVFYCCWEWFFVPCGIPGITWGTAAGMWITVRVLIYRERESVGNSNEATFDLLIVSMITPWIFLLQAYLIHCFVGHT